MVKPAIGDPSGSSWLMVMLQAVIWLVMMSTDQILADWPQAAGPNGNYQVRGKAPTRFSVRKGDLVKWRISLPNTGESTPVISAGRVFVTCHTPMAADSEAGQEIFGICLDADTGKELWRRVLPATRSTDMASGFSDNTAASPVTDGKYVCFINVGGSMHTYDFDGQLIWKKSWVPFGRHHARQQEPLLFKGNVILLRTVAQDLPVEATTKAGAKLFGRNQNVWTRLHSYDLATGNLKWVAESPTSVHSLSMIGELAEEGHAILTGRGGGHQPPEEPYGLSLIDAETGDSHWDLEIKGYNAHQNAVWNKQIAAAFVGMEHQCIEILSGKIRNVTPINQRVELSQYHSVSQSYTTEHQPDLKLAGRSRPITYHTNCLIGDYHYFRSHDKNLIGRVNVSTQEVEYVQVPIQVMGNETPDIYLWDKAIENDGRNSDGFIVYQDKRSTLDGWGHVSAASPIVVGDYLYMPTMLGTVYVIRWNATRLDDKAIESISDLGPAGKTWSLSSLSHYGDRLYARTMKELICIGGGTN